MWNSEEWRIFALTALMDKPPLCIVPVYVAVVLKAFSSKVWNHSQSNSCSHLFVSLSLSHSHSPGGHSILWGMVVSYNPRSEWSNSSADDRFWTRLTWTEQEVQELWNRCDQDHVLHIHPFRTSFPHWATECWSVLAVDHSVVATMMIC